MTCTKTQGFLADSDLEVKEQVDAKKNTLKKADALKLAGQVSEIYAAKGKKGDAHPDEGQAGQQDARRRPSRSDGKSPRADSPQGKDADRRVRAGDLREDLRLARSVRPVRPATLRGALILHPLLPKKSVSRRELSSARTPATTVGTWLFFAFANAS